MIYLSRLEYRKGCFKQQTPKTYSRWPREFFLISQDFLSIMSQYICNHTTELTGELRNVFSTYIQVEKVCSLHYKWLVALSITFTFACSCLNSEANLMHYTHTSRSSILLPPHLIEHFFLLATLPFSVLSMQIMPTSTYFLTNLDLKFMLLFTSLLKLAQSFPRELHLLTAGMNIFLSFECLNVKKKLQSTVKAVADTLHKCIK